MPSYMFSSLLRVYKPLTMLCNVIYENSAKMRNQKSYCLRGPFWRIRINIIFTHTISRKFSYGAKFRVFHGYIGCHENKNHETFKRAYDGLWSRQVQARYLNHKNFLWRVGRVGRVGKQLYETLHQRNFTTIWAL